MRPVSTLFLIPFSVFMHRQRIIWMRLKEVDLELQFVGVSPVVVPLTLGNVFGFWMHGSIQNLKNCAFAILVLSFVYGFDDVRVFLGVFADDGGGAVGRGIVMDDGLEGEGGLLHHEAVQALTQERLMVINQTTNRY